MPKFLLSALISTSISIFIVPSHAADQTAGIINQTGIDNPIYLCPNHSDTTAPEIHAINPQTNQSNSWQAWVNTKEPSGKIAYNFSFKPCSDNPTAEQRFAFFSYAGAGAYMQTDNNGTYPVTYVYSGSDDDKTGGLPFYVYAIKTGTKHNCINVGDVCLIVSINTDYKMPSTLSTYKEIPYRGVNIPGFEFGAKIEDGWLAPLIKDTYYYAQNGMNTIRLPIQLMYLLPDPQGSINENSEYVKQVKEFIDFATAHNFHVIVDIHNYMRYAFFNKDNIFDPDHTIDASHPDYLQGYIKAASFLGNQFKNNPNIIFQLMNEPHNMDTQTILDVQNKAIAAIRATGAKNLILISGNDWSHLNSWVTPKGYNYGTLNAAVFLPKSESHPKGIDDPENNYAIDVHEYFTDDNPNYDPSDLSQFVKWLRDNKMKGFIGEIGIERDNPTAINSADTFITDLEQNTDVIIGWTIWAGGSRLNLYPTKDQPSVQSIFPKKISPYGCQEAAPMEIIKKHLTPTDVPNSCKPNQ